MRNEAVRTLRAIRSRALYGKYKSFTMAPASVFWNNLRVVDRRRHVKGCVVECGVWRGGLSAAMAETLGPERKYFLFDSFEGLPPVSEEDGPVAAAWQADTTSETYYDNCAAPIDFARRAMGLSGARDFELKKGWFEETIPTFTPPEPIAILRLDGDWYESTYVVLEHLFGRLAKGGIAIVDDYYAWDGCTRAVHDYFSKNKLPARIRQEHGVCVIESLA